MVFRALKMPKISKKSLSPSDGGLACSDEGAIAPWPSPGATPEVKATSNLLPKLIRAQGFATVFKACLTME